MARVGSLSLTFRAGSEHLEMIRASWSCDRNNEKYQTLARAGGLQYFKFTCAMCFVSHKNHQPRGKCSQFTFLSQQKERHARYTNNARADEQRDSRIGLTDKQSLLFYIFTEYLQIHSYLRCKRMSWVLIGRTAQASFVGVGVGYADQGGLSVYV